jgi:hypothetical protein
MRKSFYKRLDKLKQCCSVTRAVEKRCTERPDHSGAEILREFLRVNQVEHAPEEGLMTTFSRALGISNRELRKRLSARAHGDQYVPSAAVILNQLGSQWHD